MASKTSSPWPWIMLVARISLFAGIQVLIALCFYLAGFTNAWESAASWWPFTVTITNLICISLLVWLFNQDGKRYWDIFHIQRGNLKSDLLALLLLLVFLGPVSFLPNLLLGNLLFVDPQQTLALLIRPLPLWAVYISLILFPVTQGLAELPTYFSYSMPKLESQGVHRWAAVTLASLFLSLQHLAVPLLFNYQFILWRALMFLPFAFFVGIVLHWRPRLLPYLAFIHVLMDLSFAAMLIGVAY
ncbi:MAG: hypothetical protein ACK2UM_09310 [Anaerolineales bacterium]|jgi:hypothetical protein